VPPGTEETIRVACPVWGSVESPRYPLNRCPMAFDPEDPRTHPSRSLLAKGKGDAPPRPTSPPSVPLAEKVRFLQRPEAYDPPPHPVTTVETHMSWVFLAGEYAYKLKKPVRYEFLDFRTLEARRRTCREEVRLNRRLAPHVYLGVVPLTQEPGGGLALKGSGPAVDWLVRMRRLPSERMLDRILVRGTWKPRDLDPAARLLAQFYASLPSLPMEPGGYVERFREEVTGTRRELTKPDFGLPAGTIREIAREQLRFLEGHAPLLSARAEEGRVVEGHGDLRPDHIHLGPPPAVIDCLEFSLELRTVDPADELAYLDLECRRLESPEVGPIFLEAYRDRTGDDPPEPLLSFYRSVRASIRARLTIWHLRDDHVPDPDLWQTRARRYLELSRQALVGP
jgi:uncharacterized protein